ncbi:MAG: hypothetical protein PVF56_02900 [Desulfobacterales bacterium]|jgi:hypothetical protein
MNKHKIRLVGLMLGFTAAVVMGVSLAQAEEKKDMQGWGIDDAYNKHYNIKEYEKLRAWVVRVKEVIPMPGMSPATAMEVREGDEIIEVHICPTWYKKPEDIRVKKGERIKIKGVWAYIDGKDVFMASKIKRDPDFEIVKVRLTKDGTPFWTMTPERLAKELAQK